MSRTRAVRLAALVLSVFCNFQLRRAGDLGFYDSDYNQMQQARRPLARSFFSDEPLFNLYHSLRYRVLGTEPRAHHLLQGVLGVAAALLAFELVWSLAGDHLLAFLFLALFLTYPNRGEAMYWPGALYVPMLVLLLAAVHLARRGRHGASWGAYTAAVFTHEAAFGFLAVMAAVLWRRWRWLGLAALSNVAYLVVRQTRWFGWGDPGYLYMRQIQPGRLWDNLAASLRAHFGSGFWADTERLLREGAAGGSLLPVLAVFMVALAVVGGRERVAGMAAALAAVAGLAYWTSLRAVPDLVEVLRLALVVSGAGAAGALLLGERRYGKLAAAGALWFFAAYAPTYVLYIAPRHGYLPSVGICLLLAVMLRLPGRRPALEGVALGLAALIATGFYAAGRGEVERWVRAAGVVREFRQQMLAQYPSLPKDTRLAVEGLPGAMDGVPVLPDYALEAALREWYGHDQILVRPDAPLRLRWDHGRLSAPPR
jgi:hypothetical protein